MTGHDSFRGTNFQQLMGWEHQQQPFYAARVLQVSKNLPPEAATMMIGAAEKLANLVI
jgi:hypothetical protein